MLKYILIALAVAIAVVLVLAAQQPDVFRVQRTISIKAPPEKIFALIDDFHRWGTWSPYEKLDLAMNRIYSGAESGQGAVYAWEGNGKVGAGRMQIEQSVPFSKIGIKLDFIKPFAAHNIAEFTLTPQGDSTSVTWAMSGPSPYPVKIMHLFFNMDRIVGKDFETGLANMKTAAESASS